MGEGGGGSGYMNYTSYQIHHTTDFSIDSRPGGNSWNCDDEGWEALNGGDTSIFDENENMILIAKGGFRGVAIRGGDGYSGGGGRKGSSGGKNGEDGEDGKDAPGGKGSGFDISEVQK